MPARVAISQGTATAETLGKAYRHGTSRNIAPSASRSTIEAINDTRRLINGLIIAGVHTEVLVTSPHCWKSKTFISPKYGGKWY
jgi:hypothetical protein